MLPRSIIICWLLVALGHVFILEQPGGSAFRHFPQWRFFCKYIAVDSWDWHRTFCCFFGDAFKDMISNSRMLDSMHANPKGVSVEPIRYSTTKKNLIRGIFFWWLKTFE